MHTKGRTCLAEKRQNGGCVQYLGCGEQARQREWHARDGGFPQSLLSDWGGDEEVPYVTYRFSRGDDGGVKSLQVAQLTGVTAVGKNSR